MCALPETKFIHKHKRQWQKAFQVVLPIGCKEILSYSSCCVKLEFVAQWCGECTEYQCIQESIAQVSSSHLQLQGRPYIITTTATSKSYWKIWIHGQYAPRPVPVCVCLFFYFQVTTQLQYIEDCFLACGLFYHGDHQSSRHFRARNCLSLCGGWDEMIDARWAESAKWHSRWCCRGNIRL